MKKRRFLLPTGYRIYKQIVPKPLEDVEAFLTTEYTAGFYTDISYDKYTRMTYLSKHTLVCPYCGAETPAYTPFLTPCTGPAKFPNMQIIQLTVQEWMENQLSLFNPEIRKLFLNDVCDTHEGYLCPECFEWMTPDRGTREVIIGCSKGTVKLTVQLVDCDEYCPDWCDEKVLFLSLPAYETITFNLKNGKTHISVGSVFAKETVKTRDVSDCLGKLNEDKAIKSAMADERVRKELVNAFSQYSVNEFPFLEDTLTIENLVAFTKFVGFDREFYDAIPYEEGTYRIEKGFDPVCKRLHRISDAQQLVEECIPDTKSIRRAVYGDSAFLFYIPEIKTLCEIIGDPNLVCRILRHANAFRILGSFHSKPGIGVFLRDFRTVKKPTFLVSLMTKDWDSLMNYAVGYCAMGEKQRKAQQEMWQQKHYKPHDSYTVSFSIPVRRFESNIRNWSVDGFSFEMLKTNRDYIRAGEELRNCLVEWEDFDNPVIVVRKNRATVAAIEVMDNTVVQAFSTDNKSLNKVDGLPEAFEKWKSKFRIDESIRSRCRDIDDFDFDMDDALPF